MNAPEEPKVHRMPSALIVAVGLVLMIGKIHADSEPGGVPILLVLLGTAGYFITRGRTRSRHEGSR